MANKLIQWGMIGCGSVTEKKSAPSFNQIPNSRLVAVGSRTPAKAEDYAKRHAVPSWHRDPIDVVHDPAVDIVYIATPPGSHLQYALATIAAGKPAYIEKPMARTWQECQIINQAAVEKGVPVYVAYYRRALEYFLKVKEIVDAGKLGKMLHINLRQYFPLRDQDHNRHDLPWRVIPEISGGGHFHDMGCHALDILFYIFGDPVRVAGAKSNVGGLYEPEDTVSATLMFNHGLQATASWSFVTPEPYQQDLVVLTGEKGQLTFSIFSFEPACLMHANRKESIATVQPQHIQMPLIHSIVSELNANGACPSTGQTAALANRVMDQILGIS